MARPDLPGRRRFLGYLIAAPTLAVAVDWTYGLTDAPEARASVPTLPQPEQIFDLGDMQDLAAAPTSGLITVVVGTDGTASFAVPRAEVGQGMTTAIAMMVAEELDLPLSQVAITLADARPELLFNQMTGGSNSMRSMYTPVRTAAAIARQQLIAAAAIWPWATIGVLRGAQISALPAVTEAIAQSGSRGVLLLNAKKKVPVTLPASGGAGASEGRLARSAASTLASDCPSTEPPPQVTSITWMASMHCPNVAARIATPCGSTATSVTPGMARTADLLFTETTVPLIVGGRATIVGSAPGTRRSMANCLRPVTMSAASIRLCAVPRMVKLDTGFSVAVIALVEVAAAAVASSP